jgi:hypothetical protein
MKCECLDCGTTFDTPADHRKHYQAFHGTIEEPKVIERAEFSTWANPFYVQFSYCNDF